MNPPVQYTTELHLAIQEDRIERVVDLINRRVKVNAKDFQGFTPLHFAVLAENIYIVKLLLAAGANVNDGDNEGCQPLHIAAQLHNYDISQTLVDAGAIVNATNHSLLTPLHFAVRSKNFEITHLLVDSGANVNAKEINWGVSPLLDAVKSDNMNILTLLLNAGARIEDADYSCNTALHEAVKIQNLIFCKLLIDAKAPVNVDNRQGFVPLHDAARSRNLNIMKLLIRAGADVNKQNCFEDTPLRVLIKSLLAKRTWTSEENLNTEKCLRLLVGLTREKHLVYPLGAAIFEPIRSLFYKIIIQELVLVKLKQVGHKLDSDLMNVITAKKDYYDYFRKCMAELVMAKNTKLENSPTTFFDLLSQEKLKLMKFDGHNKDWIEDFKTRVKGFTIYGARMESNFSGRIVICK